MCTALQAAVPCQGGTEGNQRPVLTGRLCPEFIEIIKGLGPGNVSQKTFLKNVSQKSFGFEPSGSQREAKEIRKGKRQGKRPAGQPSLRRFSHPAKPSPAIAPSAPAA